MPLQISAHGFELTDALKESCSLESKEKLMPLALHNFSSKWTLSLEKGEHVVHLAWADGTFKGDVTVKTQDMYASIHQCAKKAHEQMKKAHEKKHSHRARSVPTQEVTEEPEEE